MLYPSVNFEWNECIPSKVILIGNQKYDAAANIDETDEDTDTDGKPSSLYCFKLDKKSIVPKEHVATSHHQWIVTENNTNFSHHGRNS